MGGGKNTIYICQLKNLTYSVSKSISIDQERALTA